MSYQERRQQQILQEVRDRVAVRDEIQTELTVERGIWRGTGKENYQNPEKITIEYE
jgi:hypothetical protein